MKSADIRSAYEDMQVLIRMADDLSNITVRSEEERDELKSKLAYIKSRLLKIGMSTHNALNIASHDTVS